MDMKRSAKALTFAAAVAAGMTVSGCWGFGGNVYGPPPETSVNTPTEQTQSEKPSNTGTRETADSYPTPYDATGEPEVDVYGPPPDSPD